MLPRPSSNPKHCDLYQMWSDVYACAGRRAGHMRFVTKEINLLSIKKNKNTLKNSEKKNKKSSSTFQNKSHIFSAQDAIFWTARCFLLSHFFPLLPLLPFSLNAWLPPITCLQKMLNEWNEISKHKSKWNWRTTRHQNLLWQENEEKYIYFSSQHFISRSKKQKKKKPS